MNKARFKLGTFLKIFIFLVLMAVGIEIALRIFFVIPFRSKYAVFDPEIGYRMRPGVYANRHAKTNALGFSDFPRSLEKPKGYIRLALIGDSFVTGEVPLEENIASVVENLINQKSGDRAEVLNMGLMGAGPRNYLALLNNDAPKFNVDIVGVVFFIGNDITQSHPDFEARPFFNTIGESLHSPLRIGPSLEYCHIYRLLRTANRFLNDTLERHPKESFSTKTFFSIEHQRAQIFKTTMNAYIKKSYASALDTLLEMAASAKKKGMRFFVVLAPDELQINAGLQSAFAKKFAMTASAYDFALPQKIISEQLRAHGIEYVDLLPGFIAYEASGTDSLYINNNTHWNAQGNKIAAQIIWAFLREKDYFNKRMN